MTSDTNSSIKTNPPSSDERRTAQRRETNVSTEFRFVTRLPMIINKMFGISDSGKGSIKNFSDGGILFEIPVTIQDSSFLSQISKTFEICKSERGGQEYLLLKPTDFSTIEMNLIAEKSKDPLVFFALPVWVKYFEYSSSGGALMIGLKFPENSDIRKQENKSRLESILAS